MKPRFFLLFFLLFSCQRSQEKVTRFQGVAMTIQYNIMVGKPIESMEEKTIHKLIDAVFSEVDATYNKWNPDSELSALNRLPPGVKQNISKGMENLLALTDNIHQLTGGRFDPTMEPLQALWKRNLEAGCAPSQEEAQALLPALGWDKIHFSSGVFYKDHAQTSLDLGGIAKGYCVDLLVERLMAAGYPDVFVEWGGEIRTAGKHPEGRPWTVYISKLHNPDPKQAIAVVPLTDQALATSGDYLQNWTLYFDGAAEPVTYTHIIDPLTKSPLIITHQSIATASVLASSCALADGLATGAMLFPSPHDARAWALAIQEHDPSVNFWIASRNELSTQPKGK